MELRPVTFRAAAAGRPLLLQQHMGCLGGRGQAPPPRLRGALQERNPAGAAALKGDKHALLNVIKPSLESRHLAALEEPVCAQTWGPRLH